MIQRCLKNDVAFGWSQVYVMLGKIKRRLSAVGNRGGDESSLKEATELESSSKTLVRVVDADTVEVQGSLIRPQDTENLREKQGFFMSLFKEKLTDAASSNARAKKAVWGDQNPMFVSKLLVSETFSTRYFADSFPGRSTSCSRGPRRPSYFRGRPPIHG
jgi:hypothetical protein